MEVQDEKLRVPVLETKTLEKIYSKQKVRLFYALHEDQGELEKINEEAKQSSIVSGAEILQGFEASVRV
ncbi:hypothetical protein L2E82_38034 [Cichorium intybus]|uniref:Uncharacterized protein n=1 Tax=Cichorium intybus TaxID=13427 RepID=A0ACB9AJS6_CICIN|nr:hypothetical protein L2E82_38034 [Cichorium intybus]